MINLIYLAVAALIIFADRLTKLWITANSSAGEVIKQFGNAISFTYVQNSGAAFSILSGRLGLLSVVSIAFCIGVIVYWIVKKPKNKLLCIALAMMTAGAFGNAIDRIVYGYVIDFIKTEFITFPVFNIADIAITIGALLLVISVFAEENNEK